MVKEVEGIGKIQVEENTIFNKGGKNMNIKQCDVCGKNIKVDKWGNGKCKNCGWIQCEASLKNPNEVKYPNITSFNNAKELSVKKQKLKPTYEEFIIIVKENLEPSFKYKNKKYGNTNFNGFEFFEFNSEKCYQKYSSIEEFDKNVNINGKHLKDLWDSVNHFELNC